MAKFTEIFQSLKAKQYFQNPRELWWLPMIVFTISALFCSTQITLATEHETAVTLAVGVTTAFVLPAEVYMLYGYKKIETFRILTMDVGVGHRSLLNCGWFVGSVSLSAWNEKSLASILVFDFTAAAILTGERLLEPKVDLGLFMFACASSVSQAYLYYGFAVKFWMFVGLAWVLQVARGYLAKLFD